ncbi:MAG: oligoendopeptidase F [Chloroflexi bacterium]|nr:oligoendopeptidase F [Chloroflexota bacterium]
MPAIRQRDDIPAADKWNVAAIYSSDDLWEQDLLKTQGLAESVAAFAGRLAESEQVLRQAIEAWFGAMRHVEKLYVYAHLRNDEDLGKSKYQDMLDRAYAVWVKISTAGAYLSPEILAIPDETMGNWLQGETLCEYRFWLEDTLRGKPHTLSPAEERVLAMVNEPLSAISRIYSVLKNVELAARLPSVSDGKGEEVQLSHGVFIKLLESQDRAVRKAAFNDYYGEFKGNRVTIAATLDANTKANVFRARVRSFQDARAASLFADNVKPEVYDALIAAVHAAFPAFYRYMALRKRLLGLDVMHMYDVYVPVIQQVELSYEFDEAVELVCAAVQPLGEGYVKAMRQGLDGGWVDRYENAGKRSGAYSSGSYDTMPYVLMNYNGSLDSVFTLAHELGHSMHSWYSKATQPYHLSDYRIIVAEVASTANETLLNHYLLQHIQDRPTRAYLIDRWLNSFRGTVFRQTMFAEFEKLIYAHVEQGQPLTVEALDARYLELVKAYFGDAIAFDDEDAPIAWEWARIDHFFYDFYVYKYATGMSAAIALTKGLLTEQDGALDRYLALLKSGGSAYPLEQLQAAGVDLTSPEPVAAALAEFDRLVGELEALV